MDLYLFPFYTSYSIFEKHYDKGNRKVFKLIFFLVFVYGLNVSKGRTIRKVIGGWGFLLHEFCFGQVRSSNCIQLLLERLSEKMCT